MRHRLLTLGMGMAAGTILLAGTANADNDFNHGRHQVVARTQLTFTMNNRDAWRHDEPRWNRHRDRGHQHGPQCRRVWIPGGYETISERVWVPAHYEEDVRAWRVKWMWVPDSPRFLHDLLVIKNDNPYDAPPCPDFRRYGRGHWENHILQEGYKRQVWVPGGWQTVEQQVHVPGHYEHICRHH